MQRDAEPHPGAPQAPRAHENDLPEGGNRLTKLTDPGFVHRWWHGADCFLELWDEWDSTICAFNARKIMKIANDLGRKWTKIANTQMPQGDGLVAFALLIHRKAVSNLSMTLWRELASYLVVPLQLKLVCLKVMSSTAIFGFYHFSESSWHEPVEPDPVPSPPPEMSLGLGDFSRNTFV